MDTVTRTYPNIFTSSYTPDSIIELCHFRDMTFDTDERVGIYLEAWMCNLSLKSFNLGIIPNFDGDESEAEKMAKFTAAENKSQKVGLRILGRKNNTGDWQEKAEIILINRGRKDYFDLLQPYLAKNAVRILEKNDALGLQLIDYGNGLLTVNDSIGIELGITVTISKKNNMDIFNARLAAIELASALNNDANFAATVTNALNLKANINNPSFTGIINNNGGGIQFPTTQVPSTNLRILDDYEEGLFIPTIIGTTTEGIVTYTSRVGTFSKIGKRIFFDIFVEWTSHTGTGVLRIKGLPYPRSDNACVTIWTRNLSYTANYSLQANLVVDSGNTVINIGQIPPGGGVPEGVAIDSAAGVMISGNYLTIN